MIDWPSLRNAIRARLTGDATLMGIVDGVFHLVIPVTVTWAKPVIELGIQASVDDEANGYGTRGEDMRLRVMCHAKGDAPGVGSSDALYAALRRADVLLTGTPLVAANQTVWSVRFMGTVPGANEPDETGVPRMSAGAIFRVRSMES